MTDNRVYTLDCDGDYAPLQVDSQGKLFVFVDEDAEQAQIRMLIENSKYGDILYA